VAYNLEDDPTEAEYHLKCLILQKTIRSRDQKRNGDWFEEDRTMVFLIPEDNDQRSLFFRAWLPESPQEHSELDVIFPEPISRAAKVSLLNADEYCDKPHMRVMGKWLEDLVIESKLSGKKITVKTLAASADVAYDEAKDPAGNYVAR
jgi:hypothetical protein